MFKQKLEQDLKSIALDLNYQVDDIVLSIPKNSSFGDYSSNIALQLTKLESIKGKQTGVDIANEISEKLREIDYIERVEVAGGGFINLWVKPTTISSLVLEILKQGSHFGDGTSGKGKKAQIEFISANPTGPLTLGNGRGGFTGDTIANVLEKAGFEVEREYYVNDVGTQVVFALGASMKKALEPEWNPPMKEDAKLYSGPYILEIASRLKSQNYNGFPENWATAGAEAARILLEEYIKPTIARMNIGHGKGFDLYFKESSLYTEGDEQAQKNREKAVKTLEDAQLIYEKDGALFLKTTEFGDDKDRVIKKSDGDYTYFFSDILHKAYIMGNKFDKLVLILGADHHGYQDRLQAAMSAFGYTGKLSILIVQLVRLIADGKEVRMSKRAGNYVTIDDLFDGLNGDVDAARFFFIAHAPNTHMNFDLELAKKQSNENPVYYVKYAHARMSGIMRNAQERGVNPAVIGNVDLLQEPSELVLIKKLIEFPEVVETIAKDLNVHQLATYAIEIADLFHKFYEQCIVLSEDTELTQARLPLVQAARLTLGQTLYLMGIEAPEKM